VDLLSGSTAITGWSAFTGDVDYTGSLVGSGRHEERWI
jgi:hypothetical protein